MLSEVPGLGLWLELVSKELNHFGVIADLFQQIGGYSGRFVLFCSFWRLIKSVQVFPFSFLKNNKNFFLLLHKIQTPGINMQNGQWLPSNLTPWTLTLPLMVKIRNLAKAVKIQLEKQIVRSTFEILERMVLGLLIRILNFPLNSILQLEIFRGN